MHSTEYNYARITHVRIKYFSVVVDCTHAQDRNPSMGKVRSRRVYSSSDSVMAPSQTTTEHEVYIALRLIRGVCLIPWLIEYLSSYVSLSVHIKHYKCQNYEMFILST